MIPSSLQFTFLILVAVTDKSIADCVISNGADATLHPAWVAAPVSVTKTK